MTDDDWDHALGGQHALLWEGGRLVAHAALVQRRLTAGAQQLRTGYVEGVAVRADRRGRGYGAAVMEVLEREIARSYDVGALGSSELGAGFYRARGWQVWRGPTWARTPNGLMRTAEEDGWIYVFDTRGRARPHRSVDLRLAAGRRVVTSRSAGRRAHPSMLRRARVGWRARL